MQETLVLIKPDAVKRQLSGEIISRYERKGLAFVLAGDNAIVSVRALNGATNPVDAAPGSIRGDYALTMDANVVHASDSPEAAAREVSLWFPEYK